MAVVLAVVKELASIKGAMKIPHLESATRAELGLRFLEEAKLLTSLKHPHIVSVIDCGRLTSGLPFMVMERLRGRTLRGVMTASCQSGKPIRAANVHEIVTAVCDALHRLHSHRPEPVIHRDVKPENIFIHEIEGVAGRATVKLLDLGLAGEPGLRAGVAMGTPRYMAPEQILGEGVCTQTDQYALAVVLYEMLSGRRPWDISSRNVDVLAQMHAEKTPTPLIQVCSWVPKAVSDGIGLALAKNPKERWPTILQFADALRDLERAEDPHHSGAADWCVTASSLASLAAYESGIPKIPQPERPGNEDASIGDEVTEPVQVGAIIENSSSSAGEPPSSGDRNHCVTDSDTVASSEGHSPSTASDTERRPAPRSGAPSRSPWVLRAVAASVLSLVAVLATAGVRELTRIGRHPQVTPAPRAAATVDSVPSDVAEPLPSGPQDETDSIPFDNEVAPPSELPSGLASSPDSSPEPGPVSRSAPRPVASAVVRTIERRARTKQRPALAIDDGRDLFLSL
jgi:serine/threonine protein kinase